VPVPTTSSERLSERLTSPLTVRADLGKCWSAWRWAADYSHGGSQGFKSPHLHPTPDDQRKRRSSGLSSPQVSLYSGWSAPYSVIA
jgi:hypothetical protein